MASQVDSFWTTSGRVDNFAFEIVAANDLKKHLGWLEGVRGGKLTFGYDTDLKVSGSLDISSTEYIENCVVRVHYRPKLGTVEKDIVLCTCIAVAANMDFEKGRYTGSIELSSMLLQYTEDKIRKAFTIGKNKSYKSEFKRLIKAINGGKYSFGSNLKDKKCTAAVAFEIGKTPMEVIQAIAEGLGGQVGVNTTGYLTINQYLTPAKKSCTLRLPTGSYSVTMPKVQIEDNGSTVPNRVSYKCTASWKQTVYVLDKKGKKTKHTSGANKGKYKTKVEKKSKVIEGRAQVSANSALHYNKRGRWITENYSTTKNLGSVGLTSTSALNTKLDNLQKDMNKKAASKLSSLTTRTRSYLIECYYLPITCGQVVEFEYVASGISLHVQAMVMSIEMDLAAGCKMSVNLKHVRYV